MKKLIFTAAFALLAVFLVYGQAADTAASEPDFTDETTIILDEAAAEEAGAAEEDGRFFSTWDFIRVILILAAVILVIYFIFFALKRVGGPKFQDAEVIRLLASQSLTTNSSVHLIEVGTKYFLVGAGEGSVSHIADIDDKETVDQLMLKNPPPQEGRKSFTDFFNLKIGRKDAGKTNVESKIQNNNKFMHDQAERLKKM